MKVLIQFLFILTLTSCSLITTDRHLDEKTFKAGDITVKWYRISELTSVHDFVDIERRDRTMTVMKANTDGIHDILIKGDTITIQTTKNLLTYDLTAKTLNCYIKIDTTITACEYMKKHVPVNAKYYCDSSSIDTTKR